MLYLFGCVIGVGCAATATGGSVVAVRLLVNGTGFQLYATAGAIFCLGAGCTAGSVLADHPVAGRMFTGCRDFFGAHGGATDAALGLLGALRNAGRLLGDLPIAFFVDTGGSDGFGFLLGVALGAGSLAGAFCAAGRLLSGDPITKTVVFDRLDFLLDRMITLGAGHSLQTGLTGRCLYLGGGA